MSEIELLQREVDRGNGGPASAEIVQSLNISWGPYQAAYKARFQVQRGYGKYVDRAARLLFLSHVVGRILDSSKELTQGEALRAQRWLNGYHPSPSVNGDGDQRDWRGKRIVEAVDWLAVHEGAITAQAVTFRVARSVA